MAYEGYLRIGGNEVINNDRAMGYSRTAECPLAWLKGPGCESLEPAIEGGQVGTYIASNIGAAPWYDLANADVSSRFYGVFGLSITGLNSSTRTASSTEGVDDGGQIGRLRKGMRSVRARVVLVARGRDALDYGAAWLSAVLDPNACGQHGAGCGTTDVEFITACPIELPPSPTDEEARAYLDDYTSKRRFLHSTSVVSGPLESDLMNVGDFWGQVFEFTIQAERPWVYTITKSVDVPVTPTVVIQDIPYNLVITPSAELPVGEVTVARNFSTNPSVETNANNWDARSYVVSGADPAALVSGSRSTDIAAGGSAASFRNRLNGIGQTNAGRATLTAEQLVDFTGQAEGTRFSVTIWGGVFIIGGADVSTLHSLTAYIIWGDSARIDTFGSTTDAFGGTVYSIDSVLPPPGVTFGRVILSADVTWGAGSDIRLYADTLGVTVP